MEFGIDLKGRHVTFWTIINHHYSGLVLFDTDYSITIEDEYDGKTKVFAKHHISTLTVEKDREF